MQSSGNTNLGAAGGCECAFALLCTRYRYLHYSRCEPSGMKFSPKLLPTVISALELCGGFRDDETDGDVGEDEGGCLEDEGG